jgi:DNA repair exonuclease SbcCD ATPase subunit
LDQKGVSIDKFQELEQSINQVQQLQQVDDEVVQDLAVQVQDAQETAKELSKTKQDMSTELGKEAAAAQDRIDALTREIEELRTLAAAVEPAITDVIQPKLQQIDTKVKELDGENEDIYNELGQHDLEIRKLSGQGGGGGAGPGPSGTPPPAPAPLPQTGQGQDAEEDARARANAAIIKAQLASLKQPTPSKQPEAIAESRLFKAIKWATGKTK